MKMLIVGAGDIGRRIIEKMPPRDSVVATTSSPAKRAALKRLGARPILANLDHPGTLRHLPRDWEVLIHTAPPQSYLTHDIRTRALLRSKAFAGRPESTVRRHRVVVYLSTSGVYGDCGGQKITESHPLNPANLRAKRRVDAEWSLTRAARRGHFKLAILRVPGIYADDRLPVERLRAGTPALLESEDVFTNHIHAADLATIALAAATRLRKRARPTVRVYHASDDSELKMGAYFDLVADAFALARPPRLPRQELVKRVSPMLLSFMSESRRLDNRRIKRELGVQLQFATPVEGVKSAVDRLRKRA